MQTWMYRAALGLAIVAGLGCVHNAFSHLIGLDGYFHIRYSHLLRTQGLITAFPWLSATLYAQNFVDDHFLFHLLQTPFTLGDLIWGAKLYGWVIATAVFFLFYHILIAHRLPYPELWTLALFVASPIFLLRISMPRAPGISLLLLLLSTLLILQRKDRWLGPLAFIYVWTYGGFPLLSVLAGCATIVSFWYEKRIRTTLLLAVGLGTAAGLIINPYFPQNLQFLFLSYTKIEMGMFPAGIPAGTEDYPYAASTAIKHTLLVVMIISVTIFLYLIRPLTLNADTMMLFLFSMVLLCLYIEVRRFIEYWPPFAFLFSAFALAQPIHDLTARHTRIVKAVVIAVLVLACTNTVHEIDRISDNEHNPAIYAKAAAYLRENTPAKSIVFTGDWDDFPILFFYNSHNYYIVGLGLHYLYFYDQQLFTRWMDITDGLIASPAEAMHDGFGAQYALCLKSDVALLRQLEKDPETRMVYEDDHASIFALEP